MKKIVLMVCILALFAACNKGAAESSQSQIAAKSESSVIAPQPSEVDVIEDENKKMSVQDFHNSERDIYNFEPALIGEDFEVIRLEENAIQESDSKFNYFMTGESVLVEELSQTDTMPYTYTYAFYNPGKTDCVLYETKAIETDEDYVMQYTIKHNGKVLYEKTRDMSDNMPPIIKWADDNTYWIYPNDYVTTTIIHYSAQSGIRQIELAVYENTGYIQMIKLDEKNGFAICMDYHDFNDFFNDGSSNSYYYCDLTNGKKMHMLDTFSDWWGEKKICTSLVGDTLYFYVSNDDLRLEHHGYFYKMNIKNGVRKDGEKDIFASTFWDTSVADFDGKYALLSTPVWRTGGSTFGQYDMDYWYERYPQYDFAAQPEFTLYNMETQTALLRGKGRALGLYKGYLVIWDEKELAFFDYAGHKQYRLDISGYLDNAENPSWPYKPFVAKAFADQTIIGINNSGYAVDLPPIAQ